MIILRGFQIDLSPPACRNSSPIKPHSESLGHIWHGSHSKLQLQSHLFFAMSIMSWERRGAERHSTGSRWAHRPTLAASTMVHLAVAYPAHLITNLLIDSSTRDRGRPQSSRCWGGKPHLLLCLPLFEAGSQLLPKIDHSKPSTPNRSISLYLHTP